MTKNIAREVMRVFTHPDLTWVDVNEPTEEALAELKRRYPFFLDIDLRDCLPPFQRPKLLVRDKYLFIVLLFPIFDRKLGTIHSAELDIFIGKDFVVTNHTGHMPVLQELVSGSQTGQNLCPTEMVNCPAHWLHSLLSRLLTSVFPMLTHLSNDINALETELFQETKAETVKEILRVKSNIVDFRRIMQGHKRVIEKFIQIGPKITEIKNLEVYFEDLVGHTKEIWDYLENDKDTIDAVYDSHTSLITHNTSLASQRLAALALIIFPTTLVAAIFAMAADNMPIKGHPYDFEIMLSLVLLTMFSTIALLKWKKWL